MEISIRESNGYELCRLYYQHALRNDLNLPERARIQFEEINFNPLNEQFDPEVWKFEVGFYQRFPEVRAFPQDNTDWARSHRQTLKKIISNETVKISKGLVKR